MLEPTGKLLVFYLLSRLMLEPVTKLILVLPELLDVSGLGDARVLRSVPLSCPSSKLMLELA
jgi:hypothetical protein